MAKEKPKLDNVPALKGIYFFSFHPDDREHSEILKNARRELERLLIPNALPSEMTTELRRTLRSS